MRAPIGEAWGPPPHRYYQWLSYELPPELYFQKREFSFTLKDDVYVRYQCFQNRQELEKGALYRAPTDAS